MKFLEFLQSLIVPAHMYKRRGLNIFISIAILLICTYLIAMPSFLHLKNSRYERFRDDFYFKAIEYTQDEYVNIRPVTDEERAKYNIISADELLDLGVEIEKSGYYIHEGSQIEIGKEYVIKSVVPVYDDEGSISDYDVYYLHIVFDEVDDKKYDIEESFRKLPNDEDKVFRHFLVVFYENRFVFQSAFNIQGKITEIVYTRKTYINLSEHRTNINDFCNSLIYCMIPTYRISYVVNAFLYVALFPSIIAFVFSLIMGSSANLRGFKEYFNVMAVSSIHLCIGIFIVSLISVPVCNVFYKFYSIIFSIYYFVIVVYTNKRTRLEKVEGQN